MFQMGGKIPFSLCSHTYLALSQWSPRHASHPAQLLLSIGFILWLSLLLFPREEKKTTNGDIISSSLYKSLSFKTTPLFCWSVLAVSVFLWNEVSLLSGWSVLVQFSAQMQYFLVVIAKGIIIANPLMCFSCIIPEFTPKESFDENIESANSIYFFHSNE